MFSCGQLKIRLRFLLAVLHLQSLKRKITIKQVNEALDSMLGHNGPHAYDAAYDDALQRIDSQPEEIKDLARRTLSILICARRLLSPEELCHALSVEVETEEVDDDNMPEMDDILMSCAGLVIVDEESNVARLVHNSAQEYFDRNGATKLPEALKYVADVCLVYSDVMEKQNRADAPFYEYAANNWWHHVNVLPTEETQGNRKLLNDKKMSDEIFNSTIKTSVSLAMPRGLRKFWQQATLKSNVLSTITQACRSGDQSLVEAFLDVSQYDMDKDRSFLLTALEGCQHHIV